MDEEPVAVAVRSGDQGARGRVPGSGDMVDDVRGGPGTQSARGPADPLDRPARRGDEGRREVGECLGPLLVRVTVTRDGMPWTNVPPSTAISAVSVSGRPPAGSVVPGLPSPMRPVVRRRKSGSSPSRTTTSNQPCSGSGSTTRRDRPGASRTSRSRSPPRPLRYVDSPTSRVRVRSDGFSQPTATRRARRCHQPSFHADVASAKPCGSEPRYWMSLSSRPAARGDGGGADGERQDVVCAGLRLLEDAAAGRQPQRGAVRRSPGHP
ncbi:hypothetical protein [Streptomyces poriticola]|uniref:hypothetical protein n=1 Tax=Streptomyces poriticola TaxID=3120506 RepID=UPI002FCE4143